MANSGRFAVGILGNAASLLLYGAPMITFTRVIKNRSTEEFSGFPYAIALLNSLLYTWYGSPLISNGLDDILVLTVNGVGIVLEFVFVCIYLKYAPKKAKVEMVRTIVGIIMVFAIISTVSLFALDDKKHRKMVVGTSGMIVSVVLYASPLAIARKVIRTRSVEFMPISFTLFSMMNSCVWMIYFLLDKNLILACPNILGVPLSICQIVLYCMYWKQPSLEEKKVDGMFDPEVRLRLGFNSSTERGNADPVGETYLQLGCENIV